MADDGTYQYWNCPCAAIPGPAPPSFVGSNYYCEPGGGSSWAHGVYLLSNPLWDNAGCSASNTCCSNTDQPWFHHQLSSITQDDVEVRICRGEDFSRGEILLVVMLELHIIVM